MHLVSHAKSTIFHTAAWAEVLRMTYGHLPCYLGIRSVQGWRSLLPLMEVRSPLTGRRGVSLPFTDQCEALGSAGEWSEALAQEALALGRNRRWKYLEWRGNSGGFRGIQPSLSFFGHEVDLTRGLEALFAGLEPSVRRAIRKAEREGLEVEVSASSDAMKTFYDLHCQTRKKHGLPPQPFAFFQNIAHAILGKGLGAVIVAKSGEVPVAAAVFFRFGRRAVFKYGASNSAHQGLRGNNWVMWKAIHWLASSGCVSLDLGRTSLDNPGLRRFKRSWGASERRIDYLRYDFRRGGFVQDRDRAQGWHNRVFSLLPVTWLRWLGGILYPHLS
jgi:CelD/BcsL family acetyltransferase involved in cellulose biosynthesis